MIRQLSYCIYALFTVLSLSVTVYAAEIDDLVNQQQLTVKISRLNQSDVVVKQPVTLAIEVATDRWFAKGTQIGQLDLEQSVVLPMSELAINGTERRNGKTWATQVREITFYPLKHGTYAIPAISITVSINTENQGIVTGTLYTKALEIDVGLPAELANLKNYIVTPKFTVDVENDLDNDIEYKIGDAFTQTITFKADNVPGMMLPVLDPPSISGLSIYRKPAQLLDTSTRGVLKGVRKETFSYIFEQAGNYHVDSQTYYWWNSQSNTVDSIHIPSLNWIVGSEVAQLNQPHDFSLTSFDQSHLIYLIYVVVFVYLINKIRNHVTLIKRLWNKLTKKQSRILTQRFLQHIKQHEYQQASFTLFKFSQLTNQKNTPNNDDHYVTSLRKHYQDSVQQTKLLDKLLSAGYGKEKLIFIVEDAKHLLTKTNIQLSHTNTSEVKNRIKLNLQ